MSVDEFAPRLSFFFNAHNDLFEEVAKYRAARKVWARVMRERFGAQNPALLALPLSYPDGRLLADRAAALQQRRAHHPSGAGGGAGRNPIAAHQFPGRGLGAAHRGSRHHCPRARSR